MVNKVGYKVNEDKYHGINEHYRIIAAFETFVNAEDFIKKCMPHENQDRFFIEVNEYRLFPTAEKIERVEEREV